MNKREAKREAKNLAACIILDYLGQDGQYDEDEKVIQQLRNYK